MPITQVNPVVQQVGQSVPTATIVLVLAGDGRVLIASAAACAIWQAKPAELVGDYFPNLFAFEVVSQESNWVQSQWEVLLAAALDRPITLQLQPKETAELDVRVRLEKDGWRAGAISRLCHPARRPPRRRRSRRPRTTTSFPSSMSAVRWVSST